ncbi:MAG: discoidin domain-containing protein [Candidatus Sericytochromatia bacterium]|nr:discoidin domain-containing protein [Candidatus Sericytochromatia bacterium]
MKTVRISLLILATGLVGVIGCQQNQNPNSSGPLQWLPDADAQVPPANSLALASRRYSALNVNLPVTSITASSNPSAAPLAIDNSLSTCWSSGPAYNPSITAKLAATSQLNQLAIKANPVGSYRVQVSNDGRYWKTVLWNQKNTTWNVETKRLPSRTNGQYVRLLFSNNRQHILVFDLQVMGVSSQTATPTPTPSTTPVASPSVTPEPTPAPSASPSPLPSASPTPLPTAMPSGMPGSAIITIEPDKILHRANSRLLGTNRNHVTSDFPNGAAKLQKMRELTPQWGDRKYLYRIGHGPTDGRYDYSYMTGFHFESVWGKNGGYPYDDVRNGIQEANVLGADQMHVVNYGTSNPEEAGRYVGYLNKMSDPNRSRYPIAQQNVRMFEIGNEIPWSMVRGHNEFAPNETVYAQRAKLFAQQMRANSDVPIQIGAVASINSNWLGNGWSGGTTTVKNILQIMGDQVDFLIYHGYPSWPLHRNGDLNTVIAQNEWNRQKLSNEIIPAIRQYGGGRDIRIANTEFFTHMYSDALRSRGLFGALYAADTLNLSFNLNLLTSVEFCFDHKELADAAFFFNNDPNNTTPIFKFQKMLAEHWGDQIVSSSGNQIPTATVAGAATNVTLPKLAYSAATSGNKVFLMVIHRLDDADIPARVSVGFTPTRITSHTLSDPQGWNAPNASVTTRPVGSLDNYTFPKSSVTILEIER